MSADGFAILIRACDEATPILRRFGDMMAQFGELWAGELAPWGWREIDGVTPT